MDNATKRRMRIDQIFKQVCQTGAVDKEELIAFCSINYGLSRRTTREYIYNLCTLKYILEKDNVLLPLKKVKKPKTEKVDIL